MFNIHFHSWSLVRRFITNDFTYKHEHFFCKCGCHKHIFYHWNTKRVSKIIKKVKDK